MAQSFTIIYLVWFWNYNTLIMNTLNFTLLIIYRKLRRHMSFCCRPIYCLIDQIKLTINHFHLSGKNYREVFERPWRCISNINLIILTMFSFGFREINKKVSRERFLLFQINHCRIKSVSEIKALLVPTFRCALRTEQ